MLKLTIKVTSDEMTIVKVMKFQHVKLNQMTSWKMTKKKQKILKTQKKVKKIWSKIKNPNPDSN